ncbi:hypothetical protein BW895_13135, partial [Bacillus cereus]
LVMLDKNDSRYIEIVELVNRIISGENEVDLIEDRMDKIIFQIYGLKKSEINTLELTKLI